jgi:predicted O-methyltransferase YrrM
MQRALRSAGVPTAGRIFSYTKPSELQALFQLASRCPMGAKALEIGSHLGASSCYLGAGLKPRNGVLFCVDTWNNETMPDGIKDTFSEFSANTSGLGGLIVTLRKRSTALRKEDILTPLDLVFIDGDHSYESVKSDFEVVSPWLSARAKVAFHDTVAFAGVSRFLGEILARGEGRLAGHIDNLSWIEVLRKTATRG